MSVLFIDDSTEGDFDIYMWHVWSGCKNIFGFRGFSRSFDVSGNSKFFISHDEIQDTNHWVSCVYSGHILNGGMG